jgi:hypothetical protein
MLADADGARPAHKRFELSTRLANDPEGNSHQSFSPNSRKSSFMVSGTSQKSNVFCSRFNAGLSALG